MHRVLLPILIFLGVVSFSPTTAFASRLYSSGFELNTASAGFDFNTVNVGTPTIVTTPVHSGTYAIKLSPTVGPGNDVDISHEFAPADGVHIAYARAYIYIESIPTNTRFDFCLDSADLANGMICVRINGTLTMRVDTNNNGHVVLDYGSVSVSAGAWHRVEIKLDDTGGGANNVVEVRLDGTTVASESGVTEGHTTGMGAIQFVATTDTSVVAAPTVYADDLAVNSSSNSEDSNQTSWPGEGYIVYLRPNAAGDNAANTGTVADIDEITPNDATDFIALNTTTSVADYNMQDPSELGIGPRDTITLVEAHVRKRGATGSATNYQKRIKSNSGATASTTPINSFSSSAWIVDSSGTTAFVMRLATVDDPITKKTWTATNPYGYSLNNLQLGVATTDGSPALNVTAMWALVEYVPNTSRIIRLRGGIQLRGGLRFL